MTSVHSVHFYSRQHSVQKIRATSAFFFQTNGGSDRDSRVFGEESKRRDSFEVVALSCPCVKFCLQDRASTWIPNNPCRSRCPREFLDFRPREFPKNSALSYLVPRATIPRTRGSSSRHPSDRSTFPVTANRPWNTLLWTCSLLY